MMDAIDTLAGVTPGSALDALRRRKPVTRDNAQASFAALFEPAEPGGVDTLQRAAVASFVAGVHADPAGRDFYDARLVSLDPEPRFVAVLAREADAAAGQGPYGSYPAGPLSAENVAGPVYAASAEAAEVLGPKLVAALEHAHMLVFHLRDSEPALLRKLEAAGWSADDIVTLSQLVAFLSFQLRAAAGLRVLGAILATAEPAIAERSPA